MDPLAFMKRLVHHFELTRLDLKNLEFHRDRQHGAPRQYPSGKTLIVIFCTYSANVTYRQLTCLAFVSIHTVLIIPDVDCKFRR